MICLALPLLQLFFLIQAKAGNIIITLKKKESGNWSHLTKSEKAASELK